MLHEDCHNDIDEHELGHEDKYDKVDWSDDDEVSRYNDVAVHATVPHTVLTVVTVLSQCVLWCHSNNYTVSLDKELPAVTKANETRVLDRFYVCILKNKQGKVAETMFFS